MLTTIADLLTLSRVIAAGVLIWLGTLGPTTLPYAVLVTVLAWTTDQWDGWIARRAPNPTRLANFDFPIDATFYVGILVYLILAKFLPPLPVLAFVLLSLAAWLVFRRKAVAIVSLRIVDLTCGALLLIHAPWLAGLAVAWLAGLALIYRRRLRERIPRWFKELGELACGR
ncbi:MAG: hypothetical protein CVU38_10385 [Chloroflexi bacterium HGW-Chloroflexi-1]|nr:MAG: hypothetical protein CVU38_10385 [Chloroflexi bacterium HGW-Chloroflexi-1]